MFFTELDVFGSLLVLTYAFNLYALGGYGNGPVVVGHPQQVFYLLLQLFYVCWCL